MDLLALLAGTRTVVVEVENNPVETVQPCQRHIQQDCTPLAVASLEQDGHNRLDCKELARSSAPAVDPESVAEAVGRDILCQFGHTNDLVVEEIHSSPGKSGRRKTMELVASAKWLRQRKGNPDRRRSDDDHLEYCPHSVFL